MNPLLVKPSESDKMFSFAHLFLNFHKEINCLEFNTQVIYNSNTNLSNLNFGAESFWLSLSNLHHTDKIFAVVSKRRLLVAIKISQLSKLKELKRVFNSFSVAQVWLALLTIELSCFNFLSVYKSMDCSHVK